MAVSVRRGVLPDTLAEGPVIVSERIYWDETKTRLLAEGHPEARFLAYPAGTALPVSMAEQIAGVERVAAEVPIEPAPEDAEKPTRRRRMREDRQVGPGVVADTSIDGVAQVLAAEPGSPLRDGADK